MGVRSSVSSLISVLALVALSATGCGLTGATSTFVVEVPQNAGAALRIAAVELEPGQTRLQNVGSYAWGEYGEDDLAVLRESLAESVAPLAAGGQPTAAVHLVIRKFLVAHSNNEGLAIACASWAMTDPSGKLAFHEQFYARDHVKLWGTVGGVKDNVHKGIAERVIRAAIGVAQGKDPQSIPFPEFAYKDFDSARAGLPDSLTTSFQGFLVLGNGYLFYDQRVSGGSSVEWAREPSHIDWPARLATKR